MNPRTKTWRAHENTALNINEIRDALAYEKLILNFKQLWHIHMCSQSFFLLFFPEPQNSHGLGPHPELQKYCNSLHFLQTNAEFHFRILLCESGITWHH